MAELNLGYYHLAIVYRYYKYTGITLLQLLLFCKSEKIYSLRVQIRWSHFATVMLF